MGKISGVIKIGRVTGGIVSFGDTFCISPVSNVKETSGGGSNLVGNGSLQTLVTHVQII